MSSAITAPTLPVRSYHRFGLSALAAIAVCAGPAAAGPVNLALWTFETAPSNFSGPHTADEGVFADQSVLFADQQDPAANYTNPLGNGSSTSFTSNRWRAGDFIQFTTSTIGFTDIELSWDWTRSGTGAESFALQWSTNGVQFSTLMNELFITPITWSSNTFNPASRVGPLTLPAGAADQNEVHVRLMAIADAPGVTGTVRFDNIQMSGMSLPAPGAALLLGGAAIPGRRRRPGC